MDSSDNEQTELLRNIWNQIKQLDRSLGQRIDATNERLDATNERIDAAHRELTAFKEQVTEGLASVRSEIGGVRVEVGGLRTAMHAGFELVARGDAQRDRAIDELRGRLDRP